MPRSSSASPAPARPRFRPIRTRTLIGDDEHAWTDNGVFNFEGGCYAKTIRLSAGRPSRRSTTPRSMFGSVLENVVMDPETGRSTSTTARYTENTRVAYPLDYIPNASETGSGGRAQEPLHADLRQLRRAAADRPADARRRRCTTSCPASPPRWPAPRKGVTEPRADLLHLLRRALHAAPAGGPNTAIFCVRS